LFVIVKDIRTMESFDVSRVCVAVVGLMWIGVAQPDRRTMIVRMNAPYIFFICCFSLF
jgi:hypothetical protein